MTEPGFGSDVDPSRGVYGISVAAELVGIGAESLRLYERRGLVTPARTDGGTRRYSEHDLQRVRRIGELLTAGLNLAGIEHALRLEADNFKLATANSKLRAENAEMRADARRAGRRTDSTSKRNSSKR